MKPCPNCGYVHDPVFERAIFRGHDKEKWATCDLCGAKLVNARPFREAHGEKHFKAGACWRLDQGAAEAFYYFPTVGMRVKRALARAAVALWPRRFRRKAAA